MGFLDQPVIAAVGMTMAMGREKAAAMPPKQGPDLFAVGLRQRRLFERGEGEEFKPSLVMRRRQGRQSVFQFEQKHQPVRLSLVTVLADDSRQVQVRR